MNGEKTLRAVETGDRPNRHSVEEAPEIVLEMSVDPFDEGARDWLIREITQAIEKDFAAFGDAGDPIFVLRRVSGGC